MPIIVRNLRLELDEPETLLIERAAKRLGVPVAAISTHAIIRRAIDARRKDVHFSYHVELALEEPVDAQRARVERLRSADAAWVDPKREVEPCPGTVVLEERPIIVGFGPAGMLAALRLAQAGYRPIVLERGREVRHRHRDVLQRFYKTGAFDPESNLLFGEGGAGAYSDGKLYTRVNNPLCRHVLEVFCQHGADPDILVDTRPHVGSDRLPTICKRIRDKIVSLGGEIRFEQQLREVRIIDGRLAALRIGDEWIEVGPVILAIGHSARDTIRMLVEQGVKIDPKPYQIGVRIEHPQAFVDHWQYGAAAGHRRLGAAEYHMVAKGAAGEHGDVYSFCMCPGGEILPANESAGLIVTNGASRANRSGPFANSGLVFTLDPRDTGMSALEAIAFQEKWERLAFESTGQSYRVPCQRASDFLAGRGSDGSLETSYPLGGQWTDIRSVIPDSVAGAVSTALPMLASKYPGFAGDQAVITAPETRASSPIRISRDKETRLAEGIEGLYPAGEGAGYAGGIISAAIDGIKSADAIIERYAQPR